MQNLSIQYSSNCSSCGLKKLCFGHGLSEVDISKLNKLVGKKPSIYKGEYLYKSGDTLKSFFAVKAGMLKVYSFDEDKKELMHGFYFAGDILGLDGLAYHKHPFSAVALDTTSICEIPFDQLTHLSSKLPSLNTQLLTLMSQEIVNSHRHTSLLTHKTAEQKVAFFIWSMSKKLESRGYLHSQFRLNILHKDIANYLNLTPETVSRILAKLCKNKVLTWAKKEVNIFDEKALRNIAGTNNLLYF